MDSVLSADLSREYVGYKSDDFPERESSPLLPRASKDSGCVFNPFSYHKTGALRNFSNIASSHRGPSRLLVAYGYFLFICLGIAPQLLQNAMFSQTPIFIRELSEHKAITTHIVAAFMLANTFAVLYLIINALKPIPCVSMHLSFPRNFILADVTSPQRLLCYYDCFRCFHCLLSSICVLLGQSRHYRRNSCQVRSHTCFQPQKVELTA